MEKFFFKKYICTCITWHNYDYVLYGKIHPKASECLLKHSKIAKQV